MFDIDNWNEIVHTLKSNKIRTLLTAFGIFWGIFMLVVMLGSGVGLQRGIFKNMGDFSTNSAFMWTQPTSKPYAGFKKGRRWNFRNGDVEAIRQNINGLERLALRIQASGDGASNAVYGKNTGNFTIYGDYPDWNNIDPVDVVHGRYINKMDIVQKRKVAVIGKLVKEKLFEKSEDPLNKFSKSMVFILRWLVFSNQKKEESRGKTKNRIFIYHLLLCNRSIIMAILYFGLRLQPIPKCL